MTDLVAKIDALTSTFLDQRYPDVSAKLFGFTELVRNTTQDPAQPFPVVINGTADRSNIRVSLDDAYEFISWVRLPGRIRAVESEDDNWGLREGRRMQATFRWIVAHRVELGENLILELVSGLPVIQDGLTGYRFVFLNPNIDIDADHETIYNTELGATEYEKHRLDWNIYAVDFTCEFIICPDNNVYRILEDGTYRLTEVVENRILE